MNGKPRRYPLVLAFGMLDSDCLTNVCTMIYTDPIPQRIRKSRRNAVRQAKALGTHPVKPPRRIRLFEPINPRFQPPARPQTGQPQL